MLTHARPRASVYAQIVGTPGNRRHPQVNSRSTLRLGLRHKPLNVISAASDATVPRGLNTLDTRHQPLGRHHHRRRRRRHDVRDRSGQARAPRPAGRHADKLGEKIRISGGGRCNFTNTGTRPDEFPLARIRTSAARPWPATRRAISSRWWKSTASPGTRKNSASCSATIRAQQVIDMLKAECDDARVQWCMPAKVQSVSRGPRGSRSPRIAARSIAQSLVIASGGLSIPQIGASPFGYRLAEQFGLKVTELQSGAGRPHFAPEELKQFERPLRPLVRCGGQLQRRQAFARTCWSPIAACPARPSCRSHRTGGRRGYFREPAAGPAMRGVARSRADLGKAPCRCLLANSCRSGFAQRWAELHFENQAREAFQRTRLREIAPACTTGASGRAAPSATKSGSHAGRRRHPRAFLQDNGSPQPARPVLHRRSVDVTGHLGGHNFQWAWSSGHAAGLAV